MNYITYVLYRILWSFGLIYVPEWDAREGVFKYEQIEVAEEEPEPEEDILAWNKYPCFNGRGANPDFSSWSKYDTEVVERRGFSETQINHYNTIKPFILQKKAVPKIAKLINKSVSLVQKIAPAVKEMIENRYALDYAAEDSIYMEFSEYSPPPIGATEGG